ncbi:MAG: four-carbon acid sugar kinase family protein [Burkholderiales bacterium]|nr:four-carbon acid sugar kinase family protein [Burkholderiales bacterium]
MLLGCIADDFTGATDLASMLVAGGMRTIQTIGVPRDRSLADAADAVVVALKSRTIDPAEAVAQSLAALVWLRAGGARQIYFKYCSTFDSTDRGNIGPVADALMQALGTDFTIACPALPANRRTTYRGHLFVGDELLSDSSMRQHPLTPMTDANLVRVLGRQTRHKVGLVAYPEVAGGAQRIRTAFERLRSDGVRYAIVDVLCDEDLVAIGAACADLPLITAGSGVALGLPQNFVRLGLLSAHTDAARLPSTGGLAAVLAGSCSEATRRQVATMAGRHPAIAIDPLTGAGADALASAAIERARSDIVAGRVVLFYSSADPGAVAAVQEKLGSGHAAALIEGVFARLAQELVALGVRRLVVAGGETSGAVVQALGVQALAIGAAIDPGVPWTMSLGEPRIALALKSGNFGADDFFDKALGMMS